MNKERFREILQSGFFLREESNSYEHGENIEAIINHPEIEAIFEDEGAEIEYSRGDRCPHGESTYVGTKYCEQFCSYSCDCTYSEGNSKRVDDFNKGATS